FSGFWSRRLREGEDPSPWILTGSDASFATINTINDSRFLKRDLVHLQKFFLCPSEIMSNTDADLRDQIQRKAAKHRQYYETIVGIDNASCRDSREDREMAPDVSETESAELVDVNINKRESPSPEPVDDENAGNGEPPGGNGKRQRRQGVYELSSPGVVEEDPSIFKSVKQLRENYLAMLEKTSRHLALRAKENAEKDKFDLLVPPPSGYCSSSASAGSDDEREKTWTQQKQTVRRSASSDSAVHSDEDALGSNWGEKKEEYNVNEDAYRNMLKPDLKLPKGVLELFGMRFVVLSGADMNKFKKRTGFVVKSPYSPRGSIDHSNVPSRTIIEAQYVPLPLDRKFSADCVSEVAAEDDPTGSRRQSCFSEGDTPRYRYWRTPSVVVSDYSDDIMGLTLEDIEYIRNKKENSSSPDSSLHSSCSNLNYCGSSISALDGDYVLNKPYRKSSNCSTCSTLSDEEGDGTLHPQRSKEVSGVFFVLLTLIKRRSGWEKETSINTSIQTERDR
ncbi:hypothetical protein NQ315_002212, partial [Exocentrus adspersus]